LLSVDILVVGIGFAHYDVDLTTRVAGAARPPFLYVSSAAQWRKDDDGYTEPLRM